MRFSFTTMPTTQFFVNERDAKQNRQFRIYTPTNPLTIRQQPNALQDILDDNRLEHVQLRNLISTSSQSPHKLAPHLELPHGAPNADRSLVPHHLRRDHRHGLALRGVHLARHDAASRLVLREADLAEPAARARAQEADVVGDLHQRAGHDVQLAVRLGERVVCREGFKLAVK